MVICKVCGEEVRVNVTFVRYSDVSYAVSDAGVRMYDGEVLAHWERDDDKDLDEHEVASTVACGCDECPYMLIEENVVEKKQDEISKIRRLGYADAPQIWCAKCDNKAVYCYRLQTHEWDTPGFYYYCDKCLPERFKAGVGTYTEEWEDV